MRFFLSIVVVLALWAAPALANEDEGLYDPAPPEGVAFFRVVHYNDAQPYRPVPADENIQAGKFYTAIQGEAGRVIFEDPAVENRTKALLVFYNATTRKNLSLKTADGTITIVENIERWRSGSREINAARIGFSVYDEAGALVALDKKTLNRGAAYAIIAHEIQPGKIDLQFIRARTDTAP